LKRKFDPENTYRNPPAVLNIILEASQACIEHFRRFFLHPMRGGHWRIATSDREGRQQQKL
jgi:hypothetical protein